MLEPPTQRDLMPDSTDPILNARLSGCKTLTASTARAAAASSSPATAARWNTASKRTARSRPQRGSGGMVTALLRHGRLRPATWVASAMTDGDRIAAEHADGVCFRSPRTRSSSASSPSRTSTYQRHYYVFCNPLLWFVQHFMWNTPRTPNIGRAVYEAWESGYIPVNEAIAEAVVREAKKAARNPAVRSASGLPPLPRARDDPRSGARRHDPSLHAHPVARPPLLGSAPRVHAPTHPRGHVRIRHRRHCRPSATSENFLALLRSPAARRRHRLRPQSTSTTKDGPFAFAPTRSPSTPPAYRSTPIAARSRTTSRGSSRSPASKTIVRVDRSEPSKNIIRGLRSYELLLERYPELRRQGQLPPVPRPIPQRAGRLSDLHGRDLRAHRVHQRPLRRPGLAAHPHLLRGQLCRRPSPGCHCTTSSS